MKNIESSQSSGMNQANVVSEQQSGKTTWDDLAKIPFNEGKIGSELKTLKEDEFAEERKAALEKIDRMKLTDAELIDLTAKWKNVEINQEALKETTEKHGNPNSFEPGMYFDYGNLPTSDDRIYRRVGTAAITDLMEQGFVRNKRETANALHIPGKSGFGTQGPGVYWWAGKNGGNYSVDLVIEANRAGAEKGYVTKDDVLGIWVTDKNTGQPVNLIDGQDHTGLEIKSHRP